MIQCGQDLPDVRGTGISVAGVSKTNTHPAERSKCATTRGFSGGHLRTFRLTRVCDEMRLSVELVTVGFLGICRQYCWDGFPVSWRADQATPERGTPIIEC